MKFIKDIIGERRERVQHGGFAPDPAAAQPVQPPEEDAMAAFFADSGEVAEAPAPLRLDAGFRMTGTGEDLPAAAAAEADGDAAQAAPEEQPPAALDEQAIAAFFAREQARSEDAAEAFFADDAEASGTLQEDGPEANEPETTLELRDGADFSRLMQPEAQEQGGAERRPYRVFTRRLKPGADHSADPAAAVFADPAPEELPEPEAGLEAAPEENAVTEPERAAALAPMQRAADLPQAAAEPRPAVASEPIDVPAPSMGRGASRAGRVKTRLLGFSPDQGADRDPFARSAKGSAPGYTEFPVGWLAVVKGPGRGAAFTLFSGVTVIGRGEDQTVRLDFGDNSISRDNHAAIAYDPEQKSFFIGHGGKANLVRRNGRPVLSTEALSAGDEIRVGETTLRFVPLCGEDFGWDQPQQDGAGHAAFR
ncbi:FHA domain-containing protein [Leisingera sp. ANG-M1]|uniref:FHA domain-containing protein n=1 Tax=Leisingera sp. ANG-M1 TaxID=1577895 RepID=UPI00068FEA08|nr:FHA domain-containing protein [Leisingera sp. ANG-M1]